MTTFTTSREFYVEDCIYAGCGVTFAVTVDFQNRRRNDHQSFYCPNGHSMVYNGKSDAQRLRDAEARETALNDQLRAAIREGDETRAALVRDRARFAAGVCPCCNRSFENVRRHMSTQHPDFAVDKLAHRAEFKCSCGYVAETFKGLRIHQGKSRWEGWDKPDARPYAAHLTRT